MIEEFELLISPEPMSGCWLWTGNVNAHNYGTFRGLAAHRVSWGFYRGEIPAGLFICHKCDVPCCVNPNHLFPGTAKDNAIDMMKKGRNKRHFGPRKRTLTVDFDLAVVAELQKADRVLAE